MRIIGQFVVNTRECTAYYITTPDGYIFQMYGSVERLQSDACLYRSYCLETILSTSLNVNNTQYCIYADRAYVLGPGTQTACPTVNATPEQLGLTTP